MKSVKGTQGGGDPRPAPPRLLPDCFFRFSGSNEPVNYHYYSWIAESEIVSYGTFPFRDLKSYKVMAVIPSTSPPATPSHAMKPVIMGWTEIKTGAVVLVNLSCGSASSRRDGKTLFSLFACREPER